MSSTVWNTQRFRELGREEKGEGRDRGDLVERKESPNGERAVKPVLSLPSKNRYWRLGSERYKIDNKYQKAKIKILEYRLDFQKYNIKEKKKKKKKVIKVINIYIYEVCFKNSLFFEK